MQNFISSSDLLCWNLVLKGNSTKFMTTDNDGNLKIRPPITAEEHRQVQREEKARTILLSALLDEHIEDINMKFLRGLPSSWSGIALILKTKGGLEYISFDDLYNKLKFLEINTKGYSSSSSTLLNAAFVSTAGSSQGNLSYQESRNGSYSGYTTTLSLSASPGFSSSKGSSKSKCNVVNDVIYSFFVHRFEKKHGRKIKFNGKENARFDKKLFKCFNCKQMGHFSRECRAQGGKNSNNYKKYKSKEAGKDISDSKSMVVVDGSIDWEGNTKPRSLENFSMVAGLEIASDADSEGEVVSADDTIPTGVFVSAGDVAAAIVSPHFETEFALMGLSTKLAYEEKIRVLSYELEEKSNILEYRQKLIDQATQEKQDLMTKLDNELANQAKWNNGGKNLYKLINSTMSVRTERGLGLDKYIREGELGIDDSKFSIFHTNSDELEGQPIYNRFASVDHMKAVLPPLTGNYMPSSNIPDIDESQMVQECSRPNHSDHDSNDSISSVSTPASESRDTIVIDCARQEDFPSVCTSSIETDVKSSNTLCNKFGSFNKESHFRKHKSVTSKSCYVCGSYLHLIKDCDLHEQRLVKRNVEGKGKLGRRPTGVNLNRPKLVSAGQQNPVSAGQQNPVSAGQQNPVSANQPNLVSAGQPNIVFAGDGILGPRPLNIQPKSTYFYSFLHNNQQIIFPITHNSLYSLYLTGGLNGKTAVKPSAGWPWTKYGMSKTKGSKINSRSKSKSWSYGKGLLGRPKSEMTWVPKKN
uniref:Ribonuclease H-like domain-containing protein n=1 Tax=Tanacetum cinerariifolium TaxID=118510 RepID=A0A6L2JZX9_TANCI|nr:ribonuclease H-like domain-containing protein [Tanacetum cinerariifolium]